MERQHDFVVFGSTGYTGSLIVDYLTRTRPAVRWAIAGRDENKLAEQRREILSKSGLEVPVVLASTGDPASLSRLAESARVVLSAVGPYVKFGEPMVQACIAGGSDYIDVTGEPAFVANMIDRYEGAAQAAGVRLVPCAGFDSVPHDLGVFFAMDAMRPQGPVEVEAFVQVSGGLSGGTWQSLLDMLGSLHDNARLVIPCPAGQGRSVEGRTRWPHFEPEVHGWAIPMPSIDPQIVLRSAGALPLYGPAFTYGHYLRLGSLNKAARFAMGAGAAIGLAQIGPIRALMSRFKSSGEGPSAVARARGFFRVTVIAKSEVETLIARVTGGDAYEATAIMASESALLLATQRERLPSVCGFLTPAVAFGERLVAKLDGAGVKFEIVRRSPKAGS